MARTDVQLMLDVKTGDDASFDFLLQKYRTPLVNFLFRMVRDEAAEDLAQEVFLRVYRARKQYVPTAKFTTWLFRIATNLALNSIRDNRYRKMETSIDVPLSNEKETVPMELSAREMCIDERLLERSRIEFIRRAVASLSEKQRAAVLLHKYEEMEYAEIAKILGCSEGALKSLLFRAYETLRMELAPLVAREVQNRAGEGSYEVRRGFAGIDRVSGPAGELRRAEAGGRTYCRLRRVPGARRGNPEFVGCARRSAPDGAVVRL